MTIKYGKGYDDTWAGFTGQPDEVREDIAAYFGLDRASVASLTLSELVVNVTQMAHGKGNVAATLGAVVIPATSEAATTPAQNAPASSGDPWAAAGAAPAATPAVNPMFAQIEACSGIPELQRLWAENQPAFTDAAVMDAYKARGRALSAAS